MYFKEIPQSPELETESLATSLQHLPTEEDRPGNGEWPINLLGKYSPLQSWIMEICSRLMTVFNLVPTLERQIQYAEAGQCVDISEPDASPEGKGKRLRTRPRRTTINFSRLSSGYRILVQASSQLFTQPDRSSRNEVRRDSELAILAI